MIHLRLEAAVVRVDDGLVEPAVVRVGGGLGHIGGLVIAGGGDEGRAGLALLVGLTGGGVGGVQAPLGLQGLVNLLGVAELEVAGLLGDDGALVLGLQLGDKL